MKKIIRWCYWELNNEFVASGYFVVMLSMYCITLLIFGEWKVDMLILLEMFLVNYLLATLQKLIFDYDREFSTRSTIYRAVWLSLLSVILILIVSTLGGWFKGMPFWVGALIYLMLLLSYATVWLIKFLNKKYDTRRLNEQLEQFKNKTRKE